MNGASDCGPTISTHAPRTGSDAGAGTKSPPCWTLFQPTLPARGATMPIVFSASLMGISTHAPRTGSDCCRGRCFARAAISTHAPRTGSDVHALAQRHRLDISTHAPRTGSDTAQSGAHARRGISTHAPRTGSDHYSPVSDTTTMDFNPRSPHGERRSV